MHCCFCLLVKVHISVRTSQVYDGSPGTLSIALATMRLHRVLYANDPDVDTLQLGLKRAERRFVNLIRSGLIGMSFNLSLFHTHTRTHTLTHIRR